MTKWQENYPPVFNEFVSGETVDVSSRCFMVFEPMTSKNIKAFETTVQIIKRLVNYD